MSKKNNITSAPKKLSPGKMIWLRMTRNKTSLASMIFLVALFTVAFAAPLFVDPNLALEMHPEAASLAPCKEHIFGTDIYGRDIFLRILLGAKTSLGIGLISVLIGTVIGGLIGAAAAYFGGKVDNLIMRIMDMFQAIPETLMCMCIVAVAGASVPALILAMVVATIPGRCRIVRASVLGVSNKEYVEAAKVAGMSDFKIVVTQMLPNAIGPIIVVATQGVASIMLTAAGLSYLGVGIQPPHPEWGALIAASRDYLRIYPYMCVIPGLVLNVTALAFNLLGDGLRDAVDPRLKD